MNVINQILSVPTLDTEDARRRKLLNILLIGIAGITAFTLVITAVLSFTTPDNPEETNQLFLTFTITLAGIAVIYFVNRYWSGVVAASLFLGLLVAVLALGDSPQEVSAGRSLFLFTIPIIMASVLLPPWTSFIVAIVVSAITQGIALNIGLPANPVVAAGFIAVALVAWLSARSLERALEDLRAINRELDQRVADRTSELAQAVARTQAEASKNQAILESIADGVIVFDQQGIAFASNSAVAQLIRRSADSINGTNLKALMSSDVPGEDQDKLGKFLQQAGKSSDNLKVQWGKRVLSITSAPVRDTTGQTSGTVVVFRDFTKEAELDRMKSAFVSMASHELRTPLNAILGYSDMLKEEAVGPLLEEQRTTVERVIANVHRMLALVNNLLDQAQIEAGGLKPHVVPVEIGHLVHDVQQTMRILATQKGLQISHTVSPEVPSQVTSDPQRLQQILINLLSNAIKFTEQGSIEVRVFCPDPQHWALQVTDTGPGIPDEAKSYVFEPFRQVADPIRRKHGGSGLGLSIVKELTQLLGGEISLTSAVGIGSTFTAVFPVELVQEQTA
jgi:PAS domain S-box-containing protein